MFPSPLTHSGPAAPGEAALWPQVTSQRWTDHRGSCQQGKRPGARPEAGCHRKVRACCGSAVCSCFPTPPPHPQSSFLEHAGLCLPLLGLVLWVGRGPSRPIGYPTLPSSWAAAPPSCSSDIPERQTAYKCSYFPSVTDYLILSGMKSRTECTRR